MGAFIGGFHNRRFATDVSTLEDDHDLVGFKKLHHGDDDNSIFSGGIQFAIAQLPLLKLMGCGMTICDLDSQNPPLELKIDKYRLIEVCETSESEFSLYMKPSVTFNKCCDWFYESSNMSRLLQFCRYEEHERMGRVKLKIKKLENPNGRQATYAKRKLGIMKKANELSILCDVEIVLLMFSPTNKPSLCIGKRSSIEETIEKFAQLTSQERAKRKLESLEENYVKQQQLLSECTSQVPYRMGIEQQLQSLVWMPNHDSRHMALDVEGSARSSFGSYSGYFGTGKSSELSSSGPENDILNDLNGNRSLQLQLDYQVNGVVQGPRTGYDTTPDSWTSTSGPCGVTMFDEPLFS
ncbi:hypothetical protein V6N11_059319 [Hibiscus sabdariffa]|uniref:MADS-box domain-containing protein n=1 Tax=Hibiscus sabdariffa TaxID=183260 RepID=A0ABR2U7K1_9ROSI